jgi:cytochrome c oxidase assembly protein subunit 11|tara:strand:+ start:196033 stop:196635 length:603 start_codon:yes stop_codon:yes gene_type:complete
MSPDHPAKEDIAQKNKRLARGVFLAVFIMVGLAYASVPLYSIFCQVTGFGGTTQFSESAPATDKIRERTIRVNFSADINHNLYWDFRAGEHTTTVNVGAQGLTHFVAKSNDDKPSAGTALYNVTPLKAGKYFHKIECFCFGEQILQPNQEVQMPVLFYIDPSFDDDPHMKDVSLITLSYTFYRAESDALDAAMEEFYEAE